MNEKGLSKISTDILDSDKLKGNRVVKYSERNKNNKENFYRGFGVIITNRLKEFNNNLLDDNKYLFVIEDNINIIFMKKIFEDIKDVKFPREYYENKYLNSEELPNVFSLLLTLVETKLINLDKQIGFVYVDNKDDLKNVRNTFHDDNRENIEEILTELTNDDDLYEELYRNLLELTFEVLGRHSISVIDLSLNKLIFLTKADEKEFHKYNYFYYINIEKYFEDRELEIEESYYLDEYFILRNKIVEDGISGFIGD